MTSAYRDGPRASMTAREAAEAHAAGKRVIVDVRDPDEFAAVRIAGSINIPLGQLPARLGELPADRALVVVCLSGTRSAIAAATVAQDGREAANVDGGLLAWRDAGLPLAS